MQELQQRMTASEFQDWKAFLLLEPFGSTRDDHRFGVLAATMSNIFKANSVARYKPSDFFPEYVPRVQSWEQQLQIVEMLNAAFGGRDLRQKPVDQ